MEDPETAGGIVDDDDEEEDLDSVVARAAYEWMWSQNTDAATRKSPTSVDIRAILSLPFGGFMGLPMAQDLDWSNSDLGNDADIAHRLMKPINTFLTDREFDDLDGTAAGFDFTFYHLFSYHDKAAQRLLWEYPEDRRTVAYIAKRTFAVDYDQLTDKYGQLLKRANDGSELAQSRLFALLMWMPYCGCRTASIPLYLWPDALSPELREECRQRATGLIRDLHDWTTYAANSIQEVAARLLLRSSLVTYSNILGGETMERIVAASNHPTSTGGSRLSFPPISVVNVMGDIINSQVQVGTIASAQYKGQDR